MLLSVVISLIIIGVYVIINIIGEGPNLKDPSKYRFRIDRELFPEITFYNSPKEVILQLKEKITKVSILNQTI